MIRNASKSGTKNASFLVEFAPPFGSSEVYDKTTRQKFLAFFWKIVFRKILSKIDDPSLQEICFHVCSKAVWHLISKKNEKSGRSRRGAKLKLLRRDARSLRFLIILSYAAARLVRIASLTFQAGHLRCKVVPCRYRFENGKENRRPCKMLKRKLKKQKFADFSVVSFCRRLGWS